MLRTASTTICARSIHNVCRIEIRIADQAARSDQECIRDSLHDRRVHGPAGLTSRDGLACNSDTLGELGLCQAAHLPPMRDVLHHPPVGGRPMDCP
jgi:hypothetical protein